jgi:hypothetical protein
MSQGEPTPSLEEGRRGRPTLLSAEVPPGNRQPLRCEDSEVCAHGAAEPVFGPVSGSKGGHTREEPGCRGDPAHGRGAEARSQQVKKPRRATGDARV